MRSQTRHREHEHEFHEPDEIHVDEHIQVIQQCNHRPVYGSTYSEKWDEHFYDEGPRCEATQQTKFYLDSVTRDSTEITWDDMPMLWETIITDAEQQLRSRELPYAIDPKQEDVTVTVVEGGVEYTVRYERGDQTVQR